MSWASKKPDNHALSGAEAELYTAARLATRLKATSITAVELGICTIESPPLLIELVVIQC